MNQRTENKPLSAESASAGRRRLLYAGVAAAAALGGAWLAWRRLALDGTSPDLEQMLWAQEFDTPQGGARLALRSFAGRPLLLNFWATWCPPCVAELPLLNSFYRAHREAGWQVVGLAIDQPASVQRFLQRQPLDFPIGLAAQGGTELARALGNLGGGLPFTVLFDAAGKVRHRKIGAASEAELQQWAALPVR
ncbi:TlpA family protein disulfide reductase [Extensimonas sp. H3M7-6]|uniref:TlpA family protein disulfide reductase n=1 Tax=Extensimonas soli TaxID=3031322 RepID=UPI0023D9A07B|nr:TlpA disulfide reductase family protein [Extensimonas sp. H3M7-6]MDF1481874.1 TlpA disulfide reductase family protein [Extensimonas sp. H3M7-6]